MTSSVTYSYWYTYIYPIGLSVNLIWITVEAFLSWRKVSKRAITLRYRTFGYDCWKELLPRVSCRRAISVSSLNTKTLLNNNYNKLAGKRFKGWLLQLLVIIIQGCQEIWSNGKKERIIRAMIKGGGGFKGMGSFASPLHTNCRIYAISGQDLAEASTNNIPMEFPIL